jgi:hypothetical protein
MGWARDHWIVPHSSEPQIIHACKTTVIWQVSVFVYIRYALKYFMYVFVYIRCVLKFLLNDVFVYIHSALKFFLML